jgi:hypothetical protein
MKMTPLIFLLIFIFGCNAQSNKKNEFPYTVGEFIEKVFGTWTNCVEDPDDDGNYNSYEMVISEELVFTYTQGNTHLEDDCSDYPAGGFIKSYGSIALTDTERDDLAYGSGYNIEATFSYVKLKVETATTGFYGTDLNNFPVLHGGDDTTPFCDEVDPGNVNWLDDSYRDVSGCDDLEAAQEITFADVDETLNTIFSINTNENRLYFGDVPFFISNDEFPDDVSSIYLNKSE